MTRLYFAAIFLCLHIIECHRIHLSDSIMDIINTQHVEKILADRRQNNNNNLDEDVTETETDIYPTSDTLIDFDYNTQPLRNRVPLPIHGDNVVMKYNDSVLPTSSYAARFPNADGSLLSDLQAYKGDKILKSSKSALFIAKKELLKQDWCKTEPFEQKIREDGCYSKNITNNFCYGQCNSFYIPKSPKRRRRNRHNQKRDHRQQRNNVDSFRSCAYCKPKEYTFTTVILKCPSLTPNYRRKRIQIVKECRCIAQNVNWDSYCFLSSFLRKKFNAQIIQSHASHFSRNSSHNSPVGIGSSSRTKERFSWREGILLWFKPETRLTMKMSSIALPRNPIKRDFRRKDSLWKQTRNAVFDVLGEITKFRSQWCRSINKAVRRSLIINRNRSIKHILISF